MRCSVISVLSFLVLSLGVNPGAFALQAEGHKIRINSCSLKVCYALESIQLQTSQLFPIWSFREGKLEISNPQSAKKLEMQNPKVIVFESATWDEVSQIYELRTRTAILIFEPESGKLSSE